jgi:hypothetical protein
MSHSLFIVSHLSQNSFSRGGRTVDPDALIPLKKDSQKTLEGSPKVHSQTRVHYHIKVWYTISIVEMLT